MKAKLSFYFLSIVLQFTCLHTANSQDISAISEIYNYDIGDEFQYRESTINMVHLEGYITYSNIEILDKYYSLNQDTLYYSRSCYDTTYYVYDDISTWCFLNYIDTISISNLDSLIRFGDIDTVYTDPSLYNGRKINSWSPSKKIIQFDSTLNEKYIEGCGGPCLLQAWNSQYGDPIVHKIELIYYLKGGEQWGDPFFVNTANLILEDDSYSIFPNPVNSFINFQFPGQNKPSSAIAAIYNISGKVIKRFKLNHTNRLDLSDLKPGVYILVVTTNDRIIREKIIKE